MYILLVYYQLSRMNVIFKRKCDMRKCRNWQTSKTKDLVSIALVWVQVPSSAFFISSENMNGGCEKTRMSFFAASVLMVSRIITCYLNSMSMIIPPSLCGGSISFIFHSHSPICRLPYTGYQSSG